MGMGSPLLNRQEKTSLTMCCGVDSLAVLQTFASIQGILVCVVWVDWVDWVEHAGDRASRKGTPYPPPLGPIIRSISVNVSISSNMSCSVLFCQAGLSLCRASLCCLIVLKCQNCPMGSFRQETDPLGKFWNKTDPGFPNRRFDRTVPGVCGFRGLKMYSRFVNDS